MGLEDHVGVRHGGTLGSGSSFQPLLPEVITISQKVDRIAAFYQRI